MNVFLFVPEYIISGNTCLSNYDKEWRRTNFPVMLEISPTAKKWFTQSATCFLKQVITLKLTLLSQRTRFKNKHIFRGVKVLHISVNNQDSRNIHLYLLFSPKWQKPNFSENFLLLIKRLSFVTLFVMLWIIVFFPLNCIDETSSLTTYMSTFLIGQKWFWHVLTTS